MGISVTSLRNKMAKGGARPSLFYAKIIFPSNMVGRIPGLSTSPNGMELDENSISFFMKAASIPESTLTPQSIMFLGREMKVPSIDRKFGQFQTTIINDEDFRIRHFFESWIELLAPGAAIFEAESGFGDDATKQVYGQLEVHQMQKDGRVSESGIDSAKYMGSYYFKDAFPTTVDQIALSWDTADGIEEFGVTFDYQYWVKKPTEDPNGNNPFTAQNNEAMDNWVETKSA